MLIDSDPVPLRIDLHQVRRAGGRFIGLGSERETFGFKAFLNLPNIGEFSALRLAGSDLRLVTRRLIGYRGHMLPCYWLLGTLTLAMVSPSFGAGERKPLS
jgi:hypothetical protein